MPPFSPISSFDFSAPFYTGFDVRLPVPPGYLLASSAAAAEPPLMLRLPPALAFAFIASSPFFRHFIDTLSLVTQQEAQRRQVQLPAAQR